MFSLDQYDAARSSAVIASASTRGTVAVRGADRRSFLHALLTNDIAALSKGKGVYAVYLTPQGRMISDMSVVETGERILLGVERQVAAPLAARFEKLIFSEDVQVNDMSDELDEAEVHGPGAAALIERATGISAAGLTGQYDNVTSGSTLLVRDDRLGMAGFVIYVPTDAGRSLRDALIRAGGVVASVDTLEVLRIESGRPRFGVDMNTETIPLEAGIEDRAISFTKGCYVGQEVIIRVMHRGHGRVARRLVRLALREGQAPSPGDKVFAGNQQVGEITSAVESPKVGAPLAMAYVHRDHAAPGTEVIVNSSKAVVYEPGY